MPSVAFDQAAEYYDSTRGFGEGVDQQVRDALVAYTGADRHTRFLELGVGTGRVALPFIQAGYDYTGTDISGPMMARLTNKLAADEALSKTYNYRLVEADITRLPFREASFEVAIAVHVLHLVDGWQTAVQEAQRVLVRPGGCLLIAYDTLDETKSEQSANRLINEQWDNILGELGINRRTLLPGLNNWDRPNTNAQLEAYLKELDAQTSVLTLLEHATPPVSPRAMARRHKERMYSSDWRLPEDIHAQAIERLEKWLDNECAEPDQPISTTSQFTAIAARW